MKTHEEALKLALEALEMFCKHGAILKLIETRDILKEALSSPNGEAQPAQEPVNIGRELKMDFADENDKRITTRPATPEEYAWLEERGFKGYFRRVLSFNDKPEEPEQEHVAWVVESEEYNAAGERPVLREIDYYSHVVDKLPAGTQLFAHPPVPTAQTEQETLAWRETYGKIIKALAAIVNVHTPDKLFDLDAIPRDPVMVFVQQIKVALDGYKPPVPTAQPKEPEQEPVAYCWKSLGTGDLFDFVENKNGDALKEQGEDFPTLNLVLLYTTPPQRKECEKCSRNSD